MKSLAIAATVVVLLFTSSASAGPADTQPAELETMSKAELIARLIELRATGRALQERLDATTCARLGLEKELGDRIREVEARCQDLTETTRGLRNTVKARDAAIDKLTNSLSAAKKALEIVKLDLTNWADVARRAQADRSAAEAKVNDLRTKLEDATRNYTASTQKLTEVTAQRDFLLQRVKIMKEQIDILRANGRESMPGVPTSQGDGEKSVGRPAITGRILKTGGGMATVDVGSNDGVKEGTELIVYRGASYLGGLVITQVHDKMAVGRLANVHGEIRDGDLVTSSLVSNSSSVRP